MQEARQIVHWLEKSTTLNINRQWQARCSFEFSIGILKMKVAQQIEVQ